MKYSGPAYDLIKRMLVSAGYAGCGYIGTEICLSEILKAKATSAMGLVMSLGGEILIDRLNTALAGPLSEMGHNSGGDDLNYTTRQNKVFEYAEEEARTLGHKVIETIDIFLALIREYEGVAGELLAAEEIILDEAREKALFVSSRYSESE